MAPSFPSERKRFRAPRTGLLTYAFTSHLPRDQPFRVSLQWFESTIAQAKVSRLATVCISTTTVQAVAFTVAGQWRSFTAFPSILAFRL
jgi:hypothetical protein